MTISSAWDLSSDAELITAVRSGESAAFGVLYERHAIAARAVARQYSNSPADAEDAVADAFSRVFAAVQGGGGPDVAFRAYLFTVIRRVALTRVESGRRAVATDDLETFEAATGPGESTEEPTMAGFERGIVSQAYKSLPERWQAVLWYTEVEELNPAQIAPILGLTANGVAALAYRAREGLRQAYLQQHLASPADEACTIINRKLGAYVRGGLAKRETALVESHLEECGACRALVLELGDVNHGMRVFIGPLVLGAIAIGVLKGVGFGGVAGAVGVGVGAGLGAGSGAAFGAGSGAAAGAGVGTGTAVGAGAGVTVGVGSGAASGIAASGLVVAGAGAATIGAPAASASTATTGTGLGGFAGSGGAGAGAAGAAVVGVSEAVSAGGLSALMAGIPIGVLGVTAAGVVVAATFGVAGLLGTFSPDEPEAGPTPVAGVEETAAPDDAPDDAAGTDGTAEDDAAEDPEGTAVPDGKDPTNIPGDEAFAPESEAGAADEPAPTSSPTPVAAPVAPGAPPVVPPLVPPVEPPPADPVTPGAPVVHAVPPTGLTLTAGTPGIVQVTVSNTGGSIAGEVLTEFIFEPGVVWDVTALGALPDGAGAGPGVRAVEVPSSAWTCAPTSAEVATCVLADLPIGATSTLIVAIRVDAPELDGESTLTVGIVTWSPDGGGVRPAPALVATRVTSPPALLVAGPVEGAVDALVAGVPQTVTIPVTNTGGTTATGVEATVDVPADVTATAAAPWSCSPAAGGDLGCTLATLARRGGSEPLRLTLTADSALRNQARSGEVLSVTVAAPGLAAVTVTSGPLEIRSAPARYTLVAGAVPPVEPGDAVSLPVTLSNIGGTDGTDLTVSAALPDGLTLVPGASGWLPCKELPDDACLTVPVAAVDVSATLPALRLQALGSSPLGPRQVVLTVTDAHGAHATTTATVTVTVEEARALATVTGLPTTVVAGEQGDVSFMIENTGTATLTRLSAEVFIREPSLKWDNGSDSDLWDCDDAPKGGGPVGVCARGGILLPGQSSMLTVVVEPASHTENGAPREVIARLRATGLVQVEGKALVTVLKR